VASLFKKKKSAMCRKRSWQVANSLCPGHGERTMPKLEVQIGNTCYRVSNPLNQSIHRQRRRGESES
jgi:hypothetical protein